MEEKIMFEEFKYFYKTPNNFRWVADFEPHNIQSEGLIEITKEEWEAHEKIYQHNYTKEQLHRREVRHQISKLKKQLVATDYQAIKYSEGWISEEEYTPIKAARQAIRNQINELEAEL